MPRKFPARFLAVLILLCFLALPFLSMVSSGGSILPPYLEISSPSSGDVLYSDFQIIYVASDDSPFRVHVFLDGNPYANDVSTPFQMSGVPDGIRTITLLAINSYGLTATRSVSVRVDASAPVLEFINPIDALNISNDELLVEWTMVDNSSVSLFLMLDDEEEIDVTGLTQWPFTELFEGPHLLKLRGLDSVGNNREIEANFTVQTGRPILLFISPERNSHHFAPDIRINWSVSPLTATLEYSLNGGAWITGALDGVDLISLNEGRHSISVNVSDGSFYTVRSLSFYIDFTGPLLSIISPLANMSFGGRTALLMWEVQEFSPYNITLQVDSESPFVVTGDSYIINNLTARTHIVTVNVTDAAGNSMEENVSFNSLVSLAPRGPMSINGDAILRSTAQMFDLPGNGSESNPIILKNVGIDASGGPYALSMMYTSLHFQIENCLFYNTSISSENEPVGKAIFLYDVSHVSITGSIARYQDHGIYQQSFSSYLNLSDNDFSHSFISGITLNQVDDALIKGNDLSNSTKWGLMTGWKTTVSRNLTVTDNDCSGHQIYGIALERLESGNVSGNDVRTESEHDTYGIYLYGGTATTTIYDNDCRNNTHGIKVAGYSTVNMVLENDCRNNPYGIYLEQAVANYIVANNCSKEDNHSGYGVYLCNGYSNNVVENDCRNNIIGIFANYSNGDTFLNNSCQNSLQYGILAFGHAGSFNIIGNNCSHAGLDAINLQTLYSAYSNVIQGNDCRYNGGLAINISAETHVQSNRLIENDCRDSSFGMIYVAGSFFDYNLFRGNILEDALVIPINLNSSTGVFNQTRIEYNLISRSATYAVHMHGDLDGVYVIGNKADNASSTAISISSNNDLMENVYVDANDVSFSVSNGVFITSSIIVNGSISANTALNIPATPVFINSSSLSNFKVDDNYCPNHPRAPLNITATILRELSISGNNFSHSGAGIILLQRIFHNVSISNNYLRETPDVLIHLQSNQNVFGIHVDGNDLIRVSGTGILINLTAELRSSSFNGNLLNQLYNNPLQIIAASLENVSVDNNICPDARDNGLNITANVIRQLSISGNNLQNSQGYGIFLSSNLVSGLQINANNLRNSGNDSVCIYSPYAMDNLEVQSNLLQQNGRNAIILSSDQMLSVLNISHNNCTSSPQYPILLRAPIVHGVLVHDNQLYEALDRPLWLDSDQIINVTISDNIAYGSNGFGLELNGTNVSAITISGNDLRSSSQESVHISSFNDLSEIRILNNLLQGSSTYGVYLFTSADIIDANISGNAVTGHSLNQIFIQCDSLQRSRVADNQAHHSVALPLKISAESIHGLFIIGNNFSSSASFAVELDSARMDNISVEDNDLRYANGDALRIVASNSLEYIHIVDNDGREVLGHGITLQSPSAIRHLDIIGNQLSLVQEDPIFISTTRLDYAHIESNICPDASSTPLRLQVSYIYNLTIVKNDFNRSSSHGVLVYADSIVTLTISQNQINDAQGDAIIIISSGNGNLSNLRIWNNFANNAIGNGSRVQAFATNNLSILDNDFYQSGRAGISLQIQGNFSSVDIINNDCRGASGDGIFLQSDSSEGTLINTIIQNNSCTDNGRYGFYIQVYSIHNLSINGNNASGSLRPLVLNTNRVQLLSITENNFSTSSYEAIKLSATMRDVIINDNDFCGSDLDGIFLQSGGVIYNLTIQRNSISSIHGNGLRIITSGLAEANIYSNHLISPLGYPVWIIAQDSDGLIINANNCSYSVVSPLFLQIDNHRSTFIINNDLSHSGSDGLVIDSISIDIMQISDNNLSYASGDGLKVLVLGQMDNVDILRNNFSFCAGTTVTVQSTTIINKLQIIDNIGGLGNGISVQALAWIGGNVSGNLLNGSISAIVSAELNLSHIDDNILSIGNITLQGSSVNIQVFNRNEVEIFKVNSTSGHILMESVNSNQMSSGFDINSSEGVSIIDFNDNHVNVSVVIKAANNIDILSFQLNVIGPLGYNAVLMEGANIKVSEFNNNSLTAVDIGLFINASKDVFLNNLCSNNVSANRGIIISAQNTTGTNYSFNNINATLDGISIDSRSILLECFNHNRFQSGANAVSFNASTIVVSSVNDNVITGAGDHFFLIQAEIVLIESFSANNMSTASLSQAVNITANQSLTVSQWNNNILQGHTHLYSSVIRIDSLIMNEFNGSLLLNGGAMILGNIDQNQFQVLTINAINLEISSVLDNNISGNISFLGTENIIIGVVQNNTVASFYAKANNILSLFSLENNSCNGALHLESSVLNITEGISRNNITDGLTVIADFATIPSITYNNITSSTVHGIDWLNSGHISVNISHNIIQANSSNSGSGVRLQSASNIDLQFYDNQIEHFQDFALYVETVLTTVANISNSSFASNGHGLLLVANDIFVNIFNSDIYNNTGDAINLSAVMVWANFDNITLVENQRGLVASNVQQLTMLGSNISSCQKGMVLNGSNICIEHTLFHNNSIAVTIGESNELAFNFNHISNSSAKAVSFYNTLNVIVQGNQFKNNSGYALQAHNCSNMTVIWNEFWDNHAPFAQAYDDGTNNWSSSRYPGSTAEEGNLWSDWLSPDENGDGIVDSPYLLDGGAQDSFPLCTLDDHYPPYLLITSPLNESMYRNGSIILQWVTADNRSGLLHYGVEILINGLLEAELDINETNYEILVSTLEEGNNTISVQVRDNDGNIQIKSITVLIDRIPPQLHISSPGEDSINNLPFQVYWVVNDVYDSNPRVDIRVDSGDWTFDVSSAYDFSALSDGNHTIELRAVDHLDNYATVYLNLSVDTTDPVINIISPISGGISNSGSVLLSWTITDASPCDVYVSSNNGVNWIQVFADSHSFNLVDGARSLRVKAIDAAGNEAEGLTTIVVDTIAPSLSLIAPIPGPISNISTVKLQWDVVEVNDWTIETKVNGESWTAIGHVTEYTFTALTDGENILHLRITDAAGHSYTTSFTLITDTTAPLLMVSVPEEGARFNTSSVLLQWTVIENNGWNAEVKANGGIWSSIGQQTQYTFTVLADGENKLSVKVTDSAGWTSEVMVNITVDTTPPALTLILPAPEATIKSSLVTTQWATDGVRSMVSWNGGEFQLATDNATHRFIISGNYSVTIRSWDDLNNMAESTVHFQVILTSMETWSPQGQEVSSGNSSISVRFNQELNQSNLTVLVNSLPVVYMVEGAYLNISMELMAGTEYQVNITGSGTDGSEIVGAQWAFTTSVNNLGMTIVLGFALVGVGATFVFIRPRTRRF